MDNPLASLKDLKGNKKVLVYAGSAAGGYVLYRYWKARQASAAATVVPAGPTDTSVAQGGGGTAMDNTNVGNSTLNTPASNAEWTQNAVSLLANQGWDGATVTAALGKYLAGQGLSDAEITIVQSALAIAGSPPVGAYGLIRVSNPPATTTTTPPATTTPASTAPTAAPGNLHTRVSTTTGFTAQWNPVPGATRYRVVVPDLGYDWQTASTVHDIPVPAARRKTRITVQVSAGNNSQQFGPMAQYWSTTK